MQKLDPAAASTALFALIFGSELSAIIGPYAVIILAASCGAAWGLGRCGPMTKPEGAWYFLKLNLTALLVTVPISSGVQYLLGWQEANWLLVPVGLLVGGVGNSWPKVGEWFVSWLGRLLERRTGTETKKDPSQ
ncbi:hypothetical protein [Acidovorax phage ACPWH]|nr:hypothetical protein [Acidovorax phage ACPWH]QXV72277.1 hypothetical protein Acf1_00080 [Acidovorax phage ACF1]